MITLNARTMTAGFDSETFLTEYYAGLGTGTNTWFADGDYVADKQVRSTWDADAGKLAYIEGSANYDFMNHVVYGEINEVVFATNRGAIGTDGDGLATGAKGLHVSGLDVSGTGQGNAFRNLYYAVKDGGIGLLEQTFAAEGQKFIGSRRGDDYVGTEHNDRIFGENGNDTLSGGEGGADKMTGGAGDDTFVIFADNARDTILDFSDGDVVDLTTFGTLDFVTRFSGGGDAEVMVNRNNFGMVDSDGDGHWDTRFVVVGDTLTESDILFA